MRSDERTIPLQEKLDKGTTCIYEVGSTESRGALESTSVRARKNQGVSDYFLCSSIDADFLGRGRVKVQERSFVF